MDTEGSTPSLRTPSPVVLMKIPAASPRAPFPDRLSTTFVSPPTTRTPASVAVAATDRTILSRSAVARPSSMINASVM